MAFEDFEELLTSQRRLIEQVIAFTVRRNRLNADDAEDFSQCVFVELIDNDYARLRKLKDLSCLRSFLITTVQHLHQDFRNKKWGKWRASAEATRQGRIAVLLERLMVRDGYTFGEACEVIRTNHGLGVSDAELERVRALLPMRERRARADETEAETLRAAEISAESAAMLAEGRSEAARFWNTLDRLVAGLDPQDRVIIEMRFEQGLTLAQISRVLHLEQPKLYRHWQDLRRMLRERLQEEGFAASEIAAYLASPAAQAEEQQVPVSARKAGPGPSL